MGVGFRVVPVVWGLIHFWFRVGGAGFDIRERVSRVATTMTAGEPPLHQGGGQPPPTERGALCTRLGIALMTLTESSFDIGGISQHQSTLIYRQLQEA